MTMVEKSAELAAEISRLQAENKWLRAVLQDVSDELVDSLEGEFGREMRPSEMPLCWRRAQAILNRL